MKGRSTLAELRAWDGSGTMPRLCVVLDPDDTPAHARFALGLSDPPRGRLTVAITPGSRQTHQLARDVLTALGKRIDVSGEATTSHEAWFRACAWIVGERIADLVVCRAHLLDRFRWERLIELAAIADARLWLLVHRPSLTRGQLEAARDWQMAITHFAAFQRRWTPAQRTQAATPAPCRIDPEVPDQEFPTFLAHCRRLLDAADFDWVLHVYWSAHAQTAAWLDQRSTAGQPAITDAAIINYLHGLLGRHATLAELTVRVRAAQAAAFPRGWLLKLDSEALAGAHFATPLSPLDEAAASALRLYGHPRYAAAATISLASGAPPSAIARVDLRDIAPDASAVTVAGQTAPVPACARAILRAQVALRRGEGAHDTDPLFVSEKRAAGGRDGRVFGRTTPRGLHQRLAAVALETGLSVVTPETSKPKPALRGKGLTVHRLG